MVNAAMKPFMKLFGIEIDHGLSPFCREFSSSEDLRKAIEDFFPQKPAAPSKCNSDGDSDSSSGNESDSGADEDKSATTVLDYSSNDEEELSPETIQTMLGTLNLSDTENCGDGTDQSGDVKGNGVSADANDPVEIDIQKFFEGDDSAAMDEFKKLIRCNSLGEAIAPAKQLIEHLELSGIEKGSITKDYKVKSLEQRWFSAKGKAAKKSDTDAKIEDGIYIERDTLVQMNCKPRKHESMEYYWVLAIFTKYYNK